MAMPSRRCEDGAKIGRVPAKISTSDLPFVD